MKLTEMFPSRFVKGEELTKPVTVTIARVEAETMRPSRTEEVTKFVLYFVESRTGRGVVLSKTLANQIAQALGSDDTEDWPGQRITLYPEPVRVGNAERVAIRARAAAPQPVNGAGG
jgi:hypothetical protein